MRFKTILLMCFVLVVMSMSVFAANQNITEENLTTTLEIYDQPTMSGVLIEDSDTSVANEIDPVPADLVEVNCTGTAEDLDGEADIDSAWGYAYLQSEGYGAADDNVNHYTDSSCDIDKTTGDGNQATITCSFNISFYAVNGTWECNITVNDTVNLQGSGTDTTAMKELLALDVEDGEIDFGSLAIGDDTGTTDFTKAINNSGNVNMTIDLNPWGAAFNDGTSMNCTTGTLDDTDLRVATSATQAYAGRTQLTADAGTGTSVPSFYIAPQTSGVNPSQGTLYFGMGIGATETPTGYCTGNLMFTAIVG